MFRILGPSLSPACCSHFELIGADRGARLIEGMGAGVEGIKVQNEQDGIRDPGFREKNPVFLGPHTIGPRTSLRLEILIVEFADESFHLHRQEHISILAGLDPTERRRNDRRLESASCNRKFAGGKRQTPPLPFPFCGTIDLAGQAVRVALKDVLSHRSTIPRLGQTLR
jgi:hypothetical protein